MTSLQPVEEKNRESDVGVPAARQIARLMEDRVHGFRLQIAFRQQSLERTSSSSGCQNSKSCCFFEKQLDLAVRFVDERFATNKSNK